MNAELQGFPNIEIDSTRVNGQPCIRGTRITVKRALEALALYPNRQELQSEYPELTDSIIPEVLSFAAQLMDDNIVVREKLVK